MDPCDKNNTFFLIQNTRNDNLLPPNNELTPSINDRTQDTSFQILFNDGYQSNEPNPSSHIFEHLLNPEEEFENALDLFLESFDSAFDFDPNDREAIERNNNNFTMLMKLLDEKNQSNLQRKIINKITELRNLNKPNLEENLAAWMVIHSSCEFRNFLRKLLSINEDNDLKKERLSEFVNENPILNIFTCFYKMSILDKIQNLDRQSCFILIVIESILSKYLEGISNDKHYSMDECNTIKSKKNFCKYNPTQYLWYLSQAILQSKKGCVSADVQNQLNLLTFLCLNKIASIGNKEKLQINPLFNPERQYYRVASNPLIEKLSLEIKQLIEITKYENEIYLVSDPIFSEVLERCHVGNHLKINKVDDFINFIDQLTENVDKTNPKWEKGIPFSYINFSPLIASNANGKQIEEQLDQLKLVLEEKKLSYDCFSHKIVFYTFLEYNKQHLLITFDWQYKIAVLIGTTGFRNSPDEAIANLLKINDLDKIFKDHHISLVELNTQGDHFPEDFCENFDAFLESPIFSKFRDLSCEESNSKSPKTPYLKLIPKAICAELMGFKGLKIDDIFAEKNITDILQVAYFALSLAMQDTIYQKDNFLAFINNIELMHQIIQNILFIVKPYSKGALESAILSKLRSGDQPLLPSELDAKIYHNASGMRTIVSTLGAVEKQKGTNKLNVVFLKNSYHETCYFLKNVKNYKSWVLEGDIYQNSGKLNFSNQSSQPNSVDVFFCEFHHNFDSSTRCYFKEKVVDYIKLLFEKKIAAKKMTVILDTTLDLENSNDIRELLADPLIQKYINIGRLNLALCRSAQKFDMLGADNYYAGIATIVNHPVAFEKFNARLDHKKDRLRGLSYQGLSHIHTCDSSHFFLDEYRQGIINNTQLLYNNIPQKLIHSENTKKLMTISRKDNIHLPYLHISFISVDVYMVIRKALDIYANTENLVLTKRNSFGFMNMNISYIKDDIRLTPGLESKADIEKYARFFEMIMNIFEETAHDEVIAIKKINEMFPFPEKIESFRLIN